jgi:hypothetical protein
MRKSHMSGDYQGLPDEDKFDDRVRYTVSATILREDEDDEGGGELGTGDGEFLDFTLVVEPGQSPVRVLIEILKKSDSTSEWTT